MNGKKNLEDILSKSAEGATHIVSSPSTFKKLQDEKIPITERFITYEEYFDNLIEQKRKNAIKLLNQLPKLDNTIANSVIAAIYEEIRASYGLGIFTSTIFNSIVLLEYAMRVRLFDERLKADPNSEWNSTETLTIRRLAKQLEKLRVIDGVGSIALCDFNDNFRNQYLHINIYKMIKGVYADNVKKVDINTGKVSVMNQMDISKYRHLWFLAKNFYDRTYVNHVLNFCVSWTNKLLSKED